MSGILHTLSIKFFAFGSPGGKSTPVCFETIFFALDKSVGKPSNPDLSFAFHQKQDTDKNQKKFTLSIKSFVLGISDGISNPVCLEIISFALDKLVGRPSNPVLSFAFQQKKKALGYYQNQKSLPYPSSLLHSEFWMEFPIQFVWKSYPLHL